MITFEDFMKEIKCGRNPENLKNTSGIYKVYLPKEIKMVVRPETDAISIYRNKILIYPTEKLEEKIEKIQSINDDDKYILYIGKARQSSRHGLKKRILSYVKYGYGACKGHRGGRAIWQLENNKKFIIDWVEFDNPDEQEKKELKLYLEKNGVLPFANWRI